MWPFRRKKQTEIASLPPVEVYEPPAEIADISEQVKKLEPSEQEFLPQAEQLFTQIVEKVLEKVPIRLGDNKEKKQMIVFLEETLQELYNKCFLWQISNYSNSRDSNNQITDHPLTRAVASFSAMMLYTPTPQFSDGIHTLYYRRTRCMQPLRTPYPWVNGEAYAAANPGMLSWFLKPEDWESIPAAPTAVQLTLLIMEQIRAHIQAASAVSFYDFPKYEKTHILPLIRTLKTVQNGLRNNIDWKANSAEDWVVNNYKAPLNDYRQALEMVSKCILLIEESPMQFPKAATVSYQHTYKYSSYYR
ncbi:hypothetical protein LRY58_03225 [Candidatus Woesebacteria bacterium]|nr:hypothetical protein [Candidatus Woesebacteria bacterium]